MAVTTVQAQIESLISRRLVEARTRGALTPEIEATSVLESIALNLLLTPRSVLYLAHLARNGLLRVVSQELAAIDTVVATVQDLDNATYSIRNVKGLESARVALLQLTDQGSLSTQSGGFQKFDLGVEEFLQKQLAKSVRRGNTGVMVRPGAEAAVSLSADFEDLKTVHAEMLDKLYSLVVGIRNFSPQLLGGFLGVSVAYRVRQDIESIIADLQADPSAAQARDYTVRLVANREALRVMGSPPSPSDPVVDSLRRLPLGADIQARTPASTVVSITADGPWVLPGGARVVLATNGETIDTSFPLSNDDLAGRSIMVGKPIEWPILVPARTHFFLDLGGRALFVPLNYTNDAVSFEKIDALSALQDALGEGGSAYAFPTPASDRLCVVTSSDTKIGIRRSMTVEHPLATTGTPTAFTLSAHELLGFGASSVGVGGALTQDVAIIAFEGLFPTYLTAKPSGAAIELCSTAKGRDAEMTISAPEVFCLPEAVTTPVASSITLYGSVGGSGSQDLDPAGIVNSGDVLVVGGRSSTITGRSGNQLLLATPVPVFNGPIVINSALTVLWGKMSKALSTFLASWLKTKYSADLSHIDMSIAPLYADATPAKRAETVTSLLALRTGVQGLYDFLSSEELRLPAGAAVAESSVISGVISTLRERKYDRASALLLKCRVREVFELDWQTASYGGELLAAMSDFVQNSVKYPNLAREEGGRSPSLPEVP